MARVGLDTSTLGPSAAVARGELSSVGASTTKLGGEVASLEKSAASSLGGLSGAAVSHGGKTRAELGSVGQVASSTGSTVTGFGQAGQKAFAGVSSEATKLTSSLGPFGGILTTVKSSLGGVASEGGAAATAMGAVGVGVVAAGAALGVLAVKGVSDFQALTGEVRKLKAITGESAEEASKLRNVAAGLGVDTDTLAKGMFKLVGNLSAAKGELGGVHVEIARGKDGNVAYGRTLDNMRAAFQSIEDPAAKNAFLLEAFKKTGMDLRPILSATNAEFERMKKNGPIFNDADLSAGRALTIAQRELGQATQQLEVDLARGIVPVLTVVAGVLTTVVHAADKVHLPIAQIGVASLAGALGVKLLASAFGSEAVAAGGAAAANLAAAASAEAVGAASVAGATKVGLLGTAAKFVAPLIAYDLAQSLGKSVRDSAFFGDAIDAVKTGLISLERHIPLVGGWLADQDEKYTRAGRAAKGHSQAVEELKAAAADLGVTLSDSALKTGKLTDADRAALTAAAEHKAAAADLSASMFELGVVIDATEAETGKLSAAHKAAAEAAKKAADEAQKYRDKIDSLAASVAAAYVSTGNATDNLHSQTITLARGFDDARTAADSLKLGLDILTGVHVSAERAAIDYEAKIDSLTKSLVENGATLDISTKKGRDNYGSILDLITSTGSLAEAMQREGSTNAEVSRTYTEHIDRLKTVLRTAGLTEAQIQALIDKYHLVPPVVRTDVQTPYIADRIADVNAFRLQLDGVPPDKKTWVYTPYIQDRVAELHGVTDAVNGIPGSKSVTITTYHRDVSEATPADAAGAILMALGGKVPRLDGGGFSRIGAGFVTSGPKAIVGEGNPSFPEFVIPTDPIYRGRAVGLFDQLGRALHIAGPSLPPLPSMPAAASGAYGGSSNSTSHTVNRTNRVQITAGPDAGDIARAVAREVAWELATASF